MKPQYLTPEETYNYLENSCHRRVTEKMFEVDSGQTAQNTIIKQILERLEVLENGVDCEARELGRYIDANKMADELSKVPWYEREDGEQAVRMVKEFPAADVQEALKEWCDERNCVIVAREDFPRLEVRHGKWINHGSFEICSVCNEEQYGHDSGRHYCPNCGSRMDL